MSDNGLFIFEDLWDRFEKVSYDQIYDDISIFSLYSVSKIFKNFGFELIDAILNQAWWINEYVISRKGMNKVKIALRNY